MRFIHHDIAGIEWFSIDTLNFLVVIYTIFIYEYALLKHQGIIPKEYSLVGPFPRLRVNLGFKKGLYGNQRNALG
jgi:hypothetical protein